MNTRKKVRLFLIVALLLALLVTAKGFSVLLDLGLASMQVSPFAKFCALLLVPILSFGTIGLLTQGIMPIFIEDHSKSWNNKSEAKLINIGHRLAVQARQLDSDQVVSAHPQFICSAHPPLQACGNTHLDHNLSIKHKDSKKYRSFTKRDSSELATTA